MKRFWTRLALIAWLLTGFLYAPSVAFSMQCQQGGGEMTFTTSFMAGHEMHMAHKPSAPPAKDTQQHKTLACAIHCIGATTGFVLPYADSGEIPSGTTALRHFHTDPLNGAIIGPPLEPPISLSA